jgi:hypothetical protein
VRRVMAKQVTAYDLREQRKFRAEHGECPGCYPYWPEGQAGVPPRPRFRGRRFAKLLEIAARARQ